MSLKIRDFIYLDSDRLKSIISQIDKGLIDSTEEIKNKSEEVSTSFGFSSILKAVGGAKFILQNQETETKSLHDFIYNKVESTLINDDLLTLIPEKVKSDDLTDAKFRESLSNTSFILAKGKVNINDYNHLRMFLEKFNDISEFIARCSVNSSQPDSPKHQKDKDVKKILKEMGMEKETINGFKLFFDTFYKDRIVIKLMPFENYPDFRLVGNLNKEFLRDDISSITYKYSTSPVSEWIIFGQIASIPPEIRPEDSQTMVGGDIEIAIHTLFNSYREIEALAQSVVYPEIAITPIAIYRE